MKKTSERKYIKIRGANEHNLKNIDVDIPRDEFVVLTGLSGSGKSSLAFDTIYAEGQRRYMESLSSYARQFLGQMEKPNVEKIEGLSPAISIDQKSTNRNPRSTVGTVTEIYDYFRLLYARIGVPHCPKCGKEIKKQTVDQMVDQIMELPERTKIQLLAPVVRGRKGRHEKLLERAKKSGYVRVRVDGNLYELSEEIALDKNIKHNIEIIVDRLVVKPGIEKRLTDSIENVLHLAEGLMIVDIIDGEPMNFSQSFSCPDCGISIDEIEPRSFSFNNPFGACPECFGLGYKMEFDEDLMIPDKRLSISEGAITVMGWQSCTDKKSFTYAILDALSKEYDFSLDTPFQDYPQEIHDVIIRGTNGREVKVHYKGQRGEGVYDVAFEGLIRNVERRYRETSSETMKAEYEEFMRITPCRKCGGQRLKAEALAVTVGGKNIAEVTEMSIESLQTFMGSLELTQQQKMIGGQILKEIQARIKKSKGGVPFDTGFVVTGRYDLSATSEIGLKAGLTEEQKKLFSYFVPVRGMSEQIVEVLDNDRRAQREGTSKTGNLLVIGRKGSGKTVLAVDIVKAIQKQRNLKQGKVAIVTGESLNKKELTNIIQKLRGGAIIIEHAGKLNSRTVKELNYLMEKKTGELLFVLEDQRKPLERLMTANPEFKKKFSSKLELPVFINDELVTFGQTYAKENGYKLDEMGILALYSRIDVMQREDHAVSVAEVKEIMDEAIAHSQKANVKHLARRVFGKGTDDSDRIILKEEDFKI